jgi:hypothetical protein
MSVSLLAAIIIQNNEIRCFAMGPFPNGKYGGVAYLMKGKQALNPIVSIEKGVYDTCKEAIDILEETIKIIRKLDLTTQREELEKILND